MHLVEADLRRARRDNCWVWLRCGWGANDQTYRWTGDSRQFRAKGLGRTVKIGLIHQVKTGWFTGSPPSSILPYSELWR